MLFDTIVLQLQHVLLHKAFPNSKHGGGVWLSVLRTEWVDEFQRNKRFVQEKHVISPANMDSAVPIFKGQVLSHKPAIPLLSLSPK